GARGGAGRGLGGGGVHLGGGGAGMFWGGIARGRREHRGGGGGTPVAAMPREQLRELLLGRGFPEETVEALVRELENCDFARFAPSASGPGEMRAALRRVRGRLGALARGRAPPGPGAGGWTSTPSLSPPLPP